MNENGKVRFVKVVVSLIAIVSILGLVFNLDNIFHTINHTIGHQPNQIFFFLKNRVSRDTQITTSTQIIFRGNFISMYKFPISNETVSIIRDEKSENLEQQVQTGAEGEFELKYSLSEKDFQEQTQNRVTLALYINISNQLIKTFPFSITKDYLSSSSIVFEFMNKVLEQTSKVQSYVNGSVEDKVTLQSISSAKVEIIYFHPMMMSKKEVITNKVGYFEFYTELDYFEVIIADVIVSKEGYTQFKASENPSFIHDKGVVLYDNYKFTFTKSIKLEKIEQ